MALIVETGQAGTTSNSYAAVADADTYFTDRGIAAWTGAQAVKEAALIRATDYLDARYRYQWKGRKVSYTQALQWPRYGASIDGDGSDGFIEGFGPISNGYIIPSNQIHPVIIRAVAELALRALAKDLAPDVLPGSLTLTRKKVGPLEIEYRGQDLPYTVWRYVDMLIGPLLNSSDMNVKMVRS